MLSMSIMKAINKTVSRTCCQWQYVPKDGPKFELRIETEWGGIKFEESGPAIHLFAYGNNHCRYKIAEFYFSGYQCEVDKTGLENFASFKKLFFEEFISELDEEFKAI